MSHLCKGFGCDPGTQNQGQCFLGLVGGERSVSHLCKGFGCDPGAVKIGGKTCFDFLEQGKPISCCVCSGHVLSLQEP